MRENYENDISSDKVNYFREKLLLQKVKNWGIKWRQNDAWKNDLKIMIIQNSNLKKKKKSNKKKLSSGISLKVNSGWSLSNSYNSKKN